MLKKKKTVLNKAIFFEVIQQTLVRKTQNKSEVTERANFLDQFGKTVSTYIMSRKLFLPFRRLHFTKQRKSFQNQHQTRPNFPRINKNDLGTSMVIKINTKPI